MSKRYIKITWQGDRFLAMKPFIAPSNLARPPSKGSIVTGVYPLKAMAARII